MFKKVFLTTLVFICLTSVISVSMAEKTSGEMLRDLGLVEGDTYGNLMEDRYLTRAEMIVLLSRMLGKYEMASNFKLPSTFIDGRDHWAKNYVAFAEMNEWTSGIGDNKFGYELRHTAQEAAVFMLKSLGYIANTDFTWENAFIKATELGLFNDVEINPNEDILRGEVFTVMINTLNTNNKDSNIVLGEKLGLFLSSEVGGGEEPAIDKFEYYKFDQEYIDSSGMGVMVSLSITEKTGSYVYRIDYKLSNTTTDKELTEGTFKLFFSDGSNMNQYGFFGSLFPGDSLDRFYQFEFLKTKTPTILEFNGGFFESNPKANTLKWKID